MSFSSSITNLKKQIIAIGNAIRNYNGTSTKYKLSEMPDAIKTVYESGYNTGLDVLSSSVSATNIGTSYTCPHDGFIAYNISCTVTNHDNSNEMTASCAVYIDGECIKKTSKSISSFGGGSMNLNGTIKVSKGQTFLAKINTSNNKSIFWSNTYTGIYFNTRID